MLIDLTTHEIILIRSALREYRTVAPDHIKSDPSRLLRWRQERDDFDNELATADLKMTSALASLL